MTLSHVLSPAQCLGYVALVLGVSAFLQRDDRRLRILNASQCLAYLIHFMLLGMGAAAMGSLIAMTRLLLSLKTRSPWVAAVILVLGGALGIHMAHDFFTSLPVVATGLATLAIFFTSGVRMRQILLCCTFMWLTINLHGGSIGGTILECIIAMTNGFTIMRMIREQQEEKTAAQMAMNQN